jgi:long-chain acyl-CoA synthetase
MLDYVPMQPTDLTLSYLPLSHIFERTCGQFAVLASGATICYAESIATIADNLLEVCPTILTSVPRLFEKIYDGVQKNDPRIVCHQAVAVPASGEKWTTTPAEKNVALAPIAPAL